MPLNQNNEASPEPEIEQSELKAVAQLAGLTSSFKVVSCSANCAVLESHDFFYKLHKVDVHCPVNVFNLIVWNAYSNEYKSMGLAWDFFTVVNDGVLYAIEKREKLQVLAPNEFQVKDVLAKAAKIKDKIQKKLGFPRLSVQIRQNGNFKDSIDKVILTRDCEFSYSDYALYNNEIINLGNSDWVLILLKNSKWVKDFQAQIVPVNLSFGSFYFAQYSKRSIVFPIEGTFEISPKWWLYSQSSGNLIKYADYLKSEMETMFATNAKILATKTEIPVALSSDYLTNSKFQLDCSADVLKQGSKFLDNANATNGQK